MASRPRMGAARRASRKLAVLGICACIVGVPAATAGWSSSAKSAPPRPPTHLRVAAAGRTSLRLSWTRSRDRARVAGYDVYRGDRRIASVSKKTTSYIFRSLRCGTSYTVGVAAHDARGSASRRPTVRGRTAACPAPVDTQAPTTPSLLTVSASSRDKLTVTWNAATDNVGVTGYEVYLAGARVGTTTATTFTFAGLTCSATYEIAVAATDSAGNVSARGLVRATTADCPDTQAPTAPSDLRVTARSTGSLTVAWTAAHDNVGVTGYEVYLTGVRVAAITATTHTLDGLSCGVAYSVAVDALDAAGNASDRTALLASTADCPDTQAPTAPTELRVTASSGSSLTVAWAAATDNVGVTGYHVYSAGALAATTSATDANLTGLTCGKSYEIAVDAVDAAGNTSSRATLVDATDGCPPTPPSGGTLRVDLSVDFDFTDPSLAYSEKSWQLELATGLQLYDYPDKSPPNGTMLVHEAAAGFPLVTDGGKTYTFTVKPGFKFSDGTPVTAANFAYAINRALDPAMSSPAVAFIGDIVGAQDVIDGKSATAAGVQVDGDKLIIKLVQPAGDFLTRLSLPFFQAIKTDTPIDPSGVRVYPSAGPYHIASWVSPTSATLERNPYYAGSRPANADQIQYTIGTTLYDQEQRVINGDTDLGGFPAADVATLAATYGVNTPDGQFHVGPQNIDWYVNLNTSRAPFNNVNLRKAVNYAVDRPMLAALMGAYAATPTDQILPPGIPGYRDASIYPLTGPDYDKAKALAGSSCGTVKLWSLNSGFGPAWANSLKSSLEQIGCTVEVTLMTRAVEITEGGKRGADFDLLVNGWSPGFLDPSEFLDVLLNGNSIKDSGNVNLSYFDNPDVNAKLAQANQLTGAARYQAYGDLDVELVTDYAPWITAVNTNVQIFNSARVGGYVFQPSTREADLNTFFVK